MSRRFVSFVVSACVAAGSTAAAQVTPSTTIAGRVATRDDAALPRVRVAANDPTTNRLVQAVMTDDRGRFTLTLPVDADAHITFTKAGFAAQRTRVSRADLPGRGAGGAKAELQVRLVRGGAIAGRVTDQSGDPLPAVQVVARRILDDKSADVEAPVEFSGDADDRGEYRIGGLPEGRYTIGPLPSRQRPETPPDPAPPTVLISVAAGDLVGNVGFAMTVPYGSGVPAEVTPTDAERSAIRGRVTNANGQPIVGATVRAMRTGAPIRFGLTDAEGRYTVDAVSAGEYRVEAIKNGYVTFQYGQESASQLGRVVAVREDQIVERIDITLPRGSAIAGAVVDEFGEPMQGVIVDVMQLRLVAGRMRALRLRGRGTDDLGRYRVFGLLPGTYVVRVQINEALANSDTQGYSPVFYPGGGIEQASRIQVALGRDVLDTDVIVRPAPAVRVTGVATDSSGKPFSGSLLLAVSERSGGIQAEPVQARANADGSFVFTNVPPGDYVIQALGSPLAGPGGGMAAGPEVAARYITITDTSPPPVFLKTTPGATLTGRIRVEGLLDVPTSRFSLQAAPADFDRAPMVGFGTTGFRVQPDGKFEYARLTGPRRLHLQSGQANWYLKSATIKGQDAADTPFDFGLEETTIAEAEIVISTHGAAIVGQVTDDRGNEVRDFSVIVFPTDRARWYTGSRFMKLARPAQNAAFRIEGLPPGDYWFAAVDRVDTANAGEWQEPALIETLVSRASRVTLGEGEVHSATLRVIRR